VTPPGFAATLDGETASWRRAAPPRTPDPDRRALPGQQKPPPSERTSTTGAEVNEGYITRRKAV